MEGKLIIFSAPSGSGKTTIVHHLLKVIPRLEFSVSACSRKKRENEQHGKDYYFFSVDEFKNKITNGEFLEWEQVYENQYYGTLYSEVQRIWSKGNHVIFDVDVIGGLNIKKIYGEKALAIFVKPPSVKELEKRLKLRSTETEEGLKKRLSKSISELSFEKEFDIVIVNDDINMAFKNATEIVEDFLSA